MESSSKRWHLQLRPAGKAALHFPPTPRRFVLKRWTPVAECLLKFVANSPAPRDRSLSEVIATPMVVPTISQMWWQLSTSSSLVEVFLPVAIPVTTMMTAALISATPSSCCRISSGTVRSLLLPIQGAEKTRPTPMESTAAVILHAPSLSGSARMDGPGLQ